MQPYDIFMLIVLVGAAVFGAWKGMAWQLASIASVLLSAIVAMRFSGLLAPSLSAQEPWNQFLAMGILFVGTSLGVWIAFRFVAKMIDRVKLKEFDRQMGALFGTAKGVLYCLILTFFAVTLSEATRQRVLASRSGYYAAILVQKGTPLMPEKVRSTLGKYIQKLDEGLDPATPPMTPDENLTGVGDEVVDNTLADLKLPMAPLSLSQGPVDQTATAPPPTWSLDTLKQGAQDMMNQQVDTMKQGAQNMVNQQVDQFGRQINADIQQQADQFGRQVDTVNQQVDQFGRQIGNTVGQTSTRYRTAAEQSARQSAEQLRSEINRGFDALGRRIQQAPMQPIR